MRRFGREGEWDVAETAISGWHGWQHTRTTYLHRDGQIIVVVDSAAGPTGDHAALTWHLDGGPWTADASARSAQTGEGVGMRRVVALPARGSDPGRAFIAGDEGRAELRETSGAGGALEAVTVFLAGDAAAAETQIERVGDADRLMIRAGRRVVELPLPAQTLLTQTLLTQTR